MLAVSETAATAIDGILTSRDLPEGAGVRLSQETPADDDGGDTGIRLDLVSEPIVGDEVIEDASVYVEPETARLLDDKVLDAEVNGDQVRFAVKDRS
jgi:hypothetical protein